MSLLQSFINLTGDGFYKHPAPTEPGDYRNSPGECRR
jgi:hypothetical protein